MSNKLEIDILLNDKEALTKLRSAMNGMGRETKRSVDSMNLSWTALASKVYVAEKAFRTVKAAIDAVMGPTIAFESAFAGVRKTVDATEVEFKKLRNALLEMSRSIPTSVNELARIEELAGQLGVRGVENLTKFTETVAKIAVTTNLTTEAAATDFARISNIMQEPINNIDRMASAVVDLGNNFATTESEIVNFAQRIAGAGRIADLSTADIFAIGAAMSSVGIEAEAGGTAVQKVLLELKERGLEGQEAFVNFVRLLQSEGDNAIDVLQRMGLEDQRLIRAFLSLANAGSVLEDAIAASSKAFEENTALTAEAEKRFKTTESQTQLLKNATVELAIAVGEKLKPAYDTVISSLTTYIQKLTEAQREHNVFGNMAQGFLATIMGPKYAEQVMGGMGGEEGNVPGGVGGTDTVTAGGSPLENLQTKKQQEVEVVRQAEDQITEAVKNRAEAVKTIETDLAKFKESLNLGMTKAEIAAQKAKIKAEKEKAQLQVQINAAAADVVNQVAIASGKTSLKAVAIVVQAVVDAINTMILATNPLLAILQITATTIAAANAISNLKSAEKALEASKGDIQAVTNVPSFATGVQNFRGGLAVVGERGPELVNLPRGSSVTPNNQIGQSVEVHFHGPVSVRSDEDIKKLALEVSDILDAERSRL